MARLRHEGRKAVGGVVESLEERKLLAGAALSAATGLLNVVGRNVNDSILVAQDSSVNGKIYVTFNGVKTGFAKSAVKQIVVKGQGGNDKVTVKGAAFRVSKITVFGGLGNDTIAGGGNAETLLGEAGNDVVIGGSGNDIIKGGADDDYVEGGVGNDKLSGEAGADLMYGDSGNDVLSGGDGNDTLGGDDEDHLVGPGASAAAVKGNDKLVGGAGDDWLLGGLFMAFGAPSQQELADDNGKDTMTGGPGADIIDARGVTATGDFRSDVVTDKENGVDFVPATDHQAVTHEGLAIHSHVVVTIQVKRGSTYTNVPLYSGIGLYGANDFAFLHTHAADGVVHFETGNASQTWTLREFFENWGVSVDSDHMGRHRGPVTVTIDGVAAAAGIDAVMPNHTGATPYPQVVVRVG